MLRIRPQVGLDDRDLVIVTSTRKGAIEVSGRVDGTAEGLYVDAAVVDEGGERLRIEPGRVQGDGKWMISAGFPSARFWSPEDPHLYRLRVVLRRGRGGEVVDEREVRFGFKELWTEGPDFYLNGVKRHLLASSTWPVWHVQADEEIRGHLEKIRDDNVFAFRLHTEPWRERWLDIADEVGVMIVDEAAMYTDSGAYAYAEPEFWENYRTHVAGMIRRDRNHACLAIWSLGNEILFMGNARHDPGLEKKLGDLGRFARGIDPHHPIMFEADLDPDGAYDIIGLHYPYELPNQHAYPAICDWLGSRVQTEAGGGMLGTRSTRFFWERRKPLYIGEYLWVPVKDFSAASVFFGDEAYLDRGEYTSRARIRAWTDQTLAYRRSGVSALCPWTVFQHGGGVSRPDAYEAQKEYYRRVAAFLRSRDNRVFAGEKVKLEYDVFNDSPGDLDLELKVMRGKDRLASRRVRLEPAGYRSVDLGIRAPKAAGREKAVLVSVLIAGDREVHRIEHTLSVEPKFAARVPAGVRVLAYDPAGKWPGSVRSLGRLAGVKPARTILIVAPKAAGPDPDGGEPVIGRSGFDTGAFLAFLRAGGRAVVLEQETLAPLGVGVKLVKHASTMTFPLNPRHPLLNGIEPEDLKFWRGDLYVARRQIVRPETGGARAIVVSGGPNSLAQAPVVEMPVGKGRLVLMQALVGEKYESEPAARRMLANAVDYLANWRPPARDRTLLLGGDDAFAGKLSSVGVVFERAAGPLETGGLAGIGLVILKGGGKPVTGSREALAGFIRAGGRLYWHRPDPEAFRELRGAVGVAGIEMREDKVAVALAAREHPLLSGVSREDVTYTTRPQGWERDVRMIEDAADRVFVPSGGEGAAVPAGVEVLVNPGAVVAVTKGTATVVLDGMNWDRGEGAAVRGRRYATALLAGLGARFVEPSVRDVYEPLPLGVFRLAGESPYSSLSGDEIVLRSAGKVEAELECAREGVYAIFLGGYSTPAGGEYAKMKVSVDGNEVAVVEMGDSGRWPAGTVRLMRGRHRLALEFTNDALIDGEDRNVFLGSVEFSPR
jgi:hypothetical protein